jgi:alkylated DNA repair dioxygenase AlkB
VAVTARSNTDELLIDRRAEVERTSLDASSWVDVARGFVRDAAAAFDAVHRAARWERTEVLRYDHYVPDRRLGAGMRADSLPLLRQIDLHLRSRYHVPFTGVAALLYRDGRDFQGLHSDREMRWLDDTLIAIVVLGQRRPFVLRPRRTMGAAGERVPAGAAPDDVVLTPGDGDLLVMGGACQRDWLHGVPGAEVSRPRISLTWRWTSRRGRPDTNPTYYDGRHFSDGPRRPGSRTRPA